MTDVIIIADSIHKGNRLITFQLRYPRIIHAEVLTHRAFARNSASSRAIPADKMIEQVKESPFVPEVWIKAHKGMSGNELLDTHDAEKARAIYLKSMQIAIKQAGYLTSAGLTKQIANRGLEAYSYIDVILTAEYDSDGLQNFFDLRCSKFPEDWKYWEHIAGENFKMSTSGAQWEMQDLANMMFNAMSNSKPIEKDNEWHVPYYNDEVNESTIMKSVARCARISYNNHLKELDLYQASIMYSRLLDDRHMSPFEHVCKPKQTPTQWNNVEEYMQYKYGLENKGCFKQWAQLRHTLTTIK